MADFVLHLGTPEYITLHTEEGIDSPVWNELPDKFTYSICGVTMGDWRDYARDVVCESEGGKETTCEACLFLKMKELE